MAAVPRLADIPRRLSPDAFWDLFGRLKHAELDFKRGVPADVRDTIAAMAMTRGGLIVHGVDDRRTFVGCPLSQNTQDRITRIAGECGVDVQLLALSVGELELTICAVPEVRGRIVTTPDGRLLRRVGSDSQPLRGDAMARFVREREHRAGEDEPLAVVDVSAFDLDAVNQALAADGRPAVAPDGVERALTDLGVAVAAAPPLGPRVLRAALVLFASEPRGHVRGAAVQLVRREGVGPGPGPSSAREECASPLADTVDCCLRFVAAHTRRFEIVTGSRREALPEYPEPVLREAIVNALAHRDYGLAGATVDITVWDDRIEVRSPGPLPGHITLENMRAEHYSRNPRIMRVMKIMVTWSRWFGQLEGLVKVYSDCEITPSSSSAPAPALTGGCHGWHEAGSYPIIDNDDALWNCGNLAAGAQAWAAALAREISNGLWAPASPSSGFSATVSGRPQAGQVHIAGWDMVLGPLMR